MLTENKEITDYSVLEDLAIENIDYIYNRLGIFDYVNRYNYIVSSCPVHNGDNKTAFSFHIEKKVWKCFSSAGECNRQFPNGMIGFIMAVKKIGRDEAINWLCKTLDIEKDNIPKIDYEEYQIKKYISANNDNGFRNKKTYNKSCLSRLDNHDYFVKRGYSKETIEEFQCGFASSGYMRNRIVFPVVDTTGEIVGFCGRIVWNLCEKCEYYHVDGDCNSYKTKKKWLNSSGFITVDVLYNINRAMESIQNSSEIILVEGIPDIMRLYQVGVKNCLSLLRADISIQQIRKIMSLGFIKKIYLFTDDDKTGENFKNINSVYRDEMTNSLSRYFNVEKVSLYGYKDIGDMPNDEALDFCKKKGWIL